jgi:hypothetical protein
MTAANRRSSARVLDGPVNQPLSRDGERTPDGAEDGERHLSDEAFLSPARPSAPLPLSPARGAFVRRARAR